MSTSVGANRRKRGFFGWTFRLLFIAFNGAMIAWLGVATYTVAQLKSEGQSESAYATGVSALVFAILAFWALGAASLGILSFLTRGRKVTVEMTPSVPPS